MDALDFVADSTRSGIRPLMANPAKSSSGKIVGQIWRTPAQVQ